MCIFFNFDHLRIKLQSLDFFRGTKFCALLLLSLHSFSSTFKLLSMASNGGELLLDSTTTLAFCVGKIASCHGGKGEI